MENLLSIPNAILFGSLRPWTLSNKGEEKFQHLLNHQLRSVRHNVSDFFTHAITAFKHLQISTEQENVNEFETLAQTIQDIVDANRFLLIQLPVFFNKKTEFYSLLIKNELIGILSVTQDQLKNADEIAIKYKLYHLFERIEGLLSRMSEHTMNDKTNLFVLDTLKLSLFNLHMELVRHYSSYLDFEILSEGELLYLVCPDFETEKDEKTGIAPIIHTFLTESKTRISVEEQAVIKKTEEKEVHNSENKVFIPRQSDFRGAGISPVSYADIRDVSAFTEFEKDLFESNIINEEYEYQKKRGNKEVLAAIYKILIQKNYFRKKNSKNGREFDEFQYRQYLDNRYKVNTAQQFTKCSQDDIQKFKQKHYWIDNIAYCR